jgi:hypothetical protein
MPRLSAIAMCRLLAEGEYSVPIAVEDSNVGAQHRGRLSRISREEAQKKLNLGEVVREVVQISREEAQPW